MTLFEQGSRGEVTQRDERTFASVDVGATLAAARETLGLRYLFAEVGLSVARGDVRLGLCDQAAYIAFVRGFVGHLSQSLVARPVALRHYATEVNQAGRLVLQLCGHFSHGRKIAALTDVAATFPVQGSAHARGRAGRGDRVGMYTGRSSSRTGKINTTSK